MSQCAHSQVRYTVYCKLRQPSKYVKPSSLGNFLASKSSVPLKIIFLSHPTHGDKCSHILALITL